MNLLIVPSGTRVIPLECVVIVQIPPCVLPQTKTTICRAALIFLRKHIEKYVWDGRSFDCGVF